MCFTSEREERKSSGSMNKTGSRSFQIAVDPDGNDLQRNILSAGGDRLLYSVFQTAAARDFHTGKGDAADRISCKQFRKFFGIVYHVQFRTSHQCDLAVDKIPMKVSIGISAAVCRDQQIGIFKIPEPGSAPV